MHWSTSFGRWTFFETNMTVLLHTVLTRCLQGTPEPLMTEFHFAGSARAARRWINKNEEQGLVIGYTMMVRETAPLSASLIDRRPEEREEDFDFATVAYRLQTRAEGKLRPVRFITASKLLNRDFGGWCGYGREIRQVEVSHEFLRARLFYSLSIEDQCRWVSEQQLKGEGWDEALMPDALLARTAEREEVWLEIGGASYDKTKLLARDRAWRGHRYQLW